MRPPWVIRTNRAFRRLYSELQAGDLLLGRLAIKVHEEYLFSDLLARGVEAFPPLLAQHLARSKCFQAQVFQNEMVPLTQVIRDRHDLIRAVNLYGEYGIKRVVTKQNRFNCGLGIHLWEDIEILYNQATLASDFPYPFVLQPFLSEITDVRVVILGDYLEAYARRNPYNFRHNIFFGGEARPYTLSPEELAFCRRIMVRGQFPYAHLDLMVTEERTYLSEINLRGGLKGAQIETQAYQEKIKALEESFLEEWLSRHPGAEIKT